VGTSAGLEGCGEFALNWIRYPDGPAVASRHDENVFLWRWSIVTFRDVVRITYTSVMTNIDRKFTA